MRHEALALLAKGVTNAEVARLLDVPVGTVGYWLHVDRAGRGALPGRPNLLCPRCGGRPLDRAAYAYLLGLYLGDGYIMWSPQQRAPSLMISCDDKWPGLMDAAEEAMRRVFPHNRPCRLRRKGCHDVKVSSCHLWCLFPQHGPGKKHERRILLQPWQQDIVDAHPWEFVRGLVHSDGCRVTNWTIRKVAGEPKRYEYARYLFTNKSDDIRRLYTDTLDMVGVDWRVTRRGTVAYNISVARRPSVALMDAYVGPKG